MKSFNLSDCGDRGWYIGDFIGAAYKTKDFEVCFQDNPRGKTASHYHKEATEITLVISGKLLLNGEIYEAGSIHILEPGDISQLEYLEPTQVVTVKTPSVPGDKYLL